MTAEIYNETLIVIEDMCLLMANKVLSCLGMTAPNRYMHAALNHDLQREQQRHKSIGRISSYICSTIKSTTKYCVRHFNRNFQLWISGSAPVGTGKTLFLSLLLARIRSQNDVALALATFAHSALKLLIKKGH